MSITDLLTPTTFKIDMELQQHNLQKETEQSIKHKIINIFGSDVEFTQDFHVGSYRHITLNIPKNAMSLSTIFELVSTHKEVLGILESSVSTCTLEHIFMQIAMQDEYNRSNILCNDTCNQTRVHNSTADDIQLSHYRVTRRSKLRNMLRCFKCLGSTE